MRLLAAFFLFQLPLLASQAVEVQQLTIDQIMEGQDFVGVWPSQVRWDGQGEHLYFRWREPGEKGKRYTYVIHRDGNGLRKLEEEEAEKQAWPRFGEWDEERRRFVFSQEGDLFLLDREGKRTQLTRTRAPESSPRFGWDDRRVLFEKDQNLFSLSLESGELIQHTDFREGQAPKEEDPTGNRGFLEEQQEKLFEEFSGDKKKEREEREARRKKRDAKAFYRGKDTVSNLQLTTDGRYVVFELTKPAGEAKRTLVPDFVTLDGYTGERRVRPKVGDLQSKQKLGIYDIETGEVRWLEQTEDSAAIAGPHFHRKTHLGALLTISSDFKTRRIWTFNPESAELTLVEELVDEAWVGGPGTFTLGWLPEGDRIYFVSEKSGWAHLYVANPDGSGLKALTRGEWEVTGVELSIDERHWYLTTSESHLGERRLYRMPLEGGDRVILTAREGNSRGILSPDEKFLAIIHSSSNQPPEIYVQANQPDAVARRLTHSTTEEFEGYPWRVPELVRIPARDGRRPWARFYRPREAAPGRPAVIFVHGAGYLQNAHKWWSSYYREYMFHHLLAEQGYHVLDIDYRGSAGYGRDWRAAIYRHMGGQDLDDQVDGARWLVEEHGVSPSRIGIYGGSYGGFITLMAMFTQPDVFAAGASLRPVTDWAHYNHWYTSRILNQPQDDAESYERSSPIYFAEGLQGALLICHGMVDTNVHFQDTVRLAQRLIELRKENWEVAIYPVEGHGFENATSWADEYKRIFRLFEENLK